MNFFFQFKYSICDRRSSRNSNNCSRRRRHRRCRRFYSSNKRSEEMTKTIFNCHSVVSHSRSCVFSFYVCHSEFFFLIFRFTSCHFCTTTGYFSQFPVYVCMRCYGEFQQRKTLNF